MWNNKKEFNSCSSKICALEVLTVLFSVRKRLYSLIKDVSYSRSRCLHIQQHEMAIARSRTFCSLFLFLTTRKITLTSFIIDRRKLISIYLCIIQKKNPPFYDAKTPMFFAETAINYNRIIGFCGAPITHRDLQYVIP